MNNGVVWTKGQSPQVSSHSSVKYPRLFEDIAKVDVSIQECRVQLYCLFKVVNGQPYFPLCIVHTPQVAPRHCKGRMSFNGLPVACLGLL